MADQNDVRRIAMTLPGTTASKDRFAFSVEHKGKPKGFAWVWMERLHPGKARVPQPAVLAVRVADATEKAALLAADPDKFFTEPHYNGYPAVLVRLSNVSETELRQVVTEAWRCMAPSDLIAGYDARDGVASAPAASRPARGRTGKASQPKRAQRVASSTPAGKRRRS